MQPANCVLGHGRKCDAPQSCFHFGDCIYTPPKRTAWSKPEYATPWRVEVYDERVLILARDGERVMEVSPGQVDGRIVPLDERKALAQRAVEAVNDIENAKAPPGEISPWFREQMELARAMRVLREAGVLHDPPPRPQNHALGFAVSHSEVDHALERLGDDGCPHHEAP